VILGGIFPSSSPEIAAQKQEEELAGVRKEMKEYLKELGIVK